MFGATNIVKESDKEKWVYNGYGIVFDEVDSWNFGNDFASDVIIFGVHNSSPSLVDNHKINFLVLVEGPTFTINGSFGSPEKKFSINSSKKDSKVNKFCLSLHHNGDNSYLFVIGEEIFTFIRNDKNVDFPTQFCLENISNGFGATESR